VLLENFSDYGDSRVHGVGDDKNKRLRSALRNAGGEVTDDTCINLHDVRRARK
jgi:hypothetical protein